MTVPRSAPVRVVIEGVTPEIDAGRFPVKRVCGEPLVVEADIFADGHDRLAGVLRYSAAGTDVWHEVPLRQLENDRWQAGFSAQTPGRYAYTVQAWVDVFRSWREGVRKKIDAGCAVRSELLEGITLIREAAARATPADARWLGAHADRIAQAIDAPPAVEAALADDLAAVLARYPDRRQATQYGRVLSVVVERERAGTGAWYEMFPRSAAAQPERHGTFRDCEARLPYVAAMGFDVLYLPPIHPIGRTHRKGPNNTPVPNEADLGSPWAIGSAEGGHTAVHRALGTLADFDHLVATAQQHGLEIAMDLALQCSPDHPYVREHPEWFRHRPDGSVQYAENPPKKYEDIFPLHFTTAAWPALWEELKRVVCFWIEHGIRIFRVDNPHTKPFAFWEWLIAAVQAEHPDVVFLAEAFTRPKVLRHLAKCGFSQSYTYFTWRTSKAELIDYFTELMHTPLREYLRPNLFANTPDILHEYLQVGGRAAFQIRLVLAATLAASYGIYGPAFELCETRAVPGTEEYLDSEKYQLRRWELDRPESVREFITRVNRVRRDNAALRQNPGLTFYPVDNDQLLCFGKRCADGSNQVLVLVNLDPYRVQAGTVEVAPEDLGVDPIQPFQVHDLLGDARYFWHGRRHAVSVDPHVLPAHIFRVRRWLRTERDFDYFA